MKWQCVQECVRRNADLKDGGDACMHYLAFPDETAHPCTNLLLSAEGDKDQTVQASGCQNMAGSIQQHPQ